MDKRKAELLNKIEENYINYLRSQVKRAKWQDELLQRSGQGETPVYHIDDVPPSKKTRDELIKTILNLRETPLIQKNIQEEPEPPEVFDRVSKPSVSPHQQDIIKHPNNSHNKLALENVELGEEEIIHQIDEEVALQKGDEITETDKVAPSGVRSEAEESLSPPESASVEEEEQLYQEGDIIAFDDGLIGIYISPVAGKDYDVVYCLRDDGSVEPRGIPFYSYKHRKIGRLPEERVKILKTRMRWMREEIVYYLDRFEDINLIPPLNHRQKQTPLPVENTNSVKIEQSEDVNKVGLEKTREKERARQEEPHSLVRGRKIIIKYGDKKWESIYWGADDKGIIVAHKTSGNWEFMHLDLTRFGDNVEYGEILSDLELLEIQRQLEAQLP
ncbi:hypothetical protein J7M23_07465 [Candidatus Sumerlaeota bacterium]|nr:hypothetical protein [Candidatus Sumerlaeota bacterium]